MLMNGEESGRTGYWKPYEGGELATAGEMVDSKFVGVWSIYENGEIVSTHDYGPVAPE